MKAKLSLIIASAAAVSVSMQAQVAFDGDYSQEFNTLATTGTGTANAWADNTTLTGWYSSRTTYNAGTGSSLTGALYSFGASSGGTLTERALGSVASTPPSGTGTIAFGVRLQNTAGVTLENFVVSYIGEQWRNGGNNTQQSLTFWYQIGSNLTNPDPNSNIGWTAVTALDFTGPVATPTSGPLGGNAFGNRVSLSAELSGVSVAPNQELFLRWVDVNDAGSDHGLAIDSFNVTGLTVVPEPSTWVLLGGGLAFLVNRLRRRN